MFNSSMLYEWVLTAKLVLFVEKSGMLITKVIHFRLLFTPGGIRRLIF